MIYNFTLTDWRGEVCTFNVHWCNDNTVWLNVFGQVEEDPRNTCLWRSFDVCGRLWTSRRIQVQHLHFFWYDCKKRLEPQSTAVPFKVGVFILFLLSYMFKIIFSYMYTCTSNFVTSLTSGKKVILLYLFYIRYLRLIWWFCSCFISVPFIYTLNGRIQIGHTGNVNKTSTGANLERSKFVFSATGWKLKIVNFT